MGEEQHIGRLGRAVTEVGASETVEIAGEPLEAMTVGPRIPAGAQVDVTGWRLLDGSRHVLSVRAPSARDASPASAATPQRSLEERLADLERRCRDL